MATSLAHDGWTALVCNVDGSIDAGSTGLWDDDARILSRHVVDFGDQELTPTGMPVARGRSWSVMLHATRTDGTAEGPALPQDAWEIDLERTVGPGMRERITVRNRSMIRAAASLTIELEADFADSLTRGRKIDHEPEIGASLEDGSLVIRGVGRHRDRVDVRGVRVRHGAGSPEPRIDIAGSARGGRLTWDLELEPRGQWTATLDYHVLREGAWRSVDAQPDREARWTAWQARRTRVEAEPAVGRAFETAANDLISLRNWDLEAGFDDDGWVPNAGVPWFTGLFGRDVLTAGWQALLLGPEIARGALAATAARQGRREDDFTEEEPGRIIHEHRRGPLSMLGIRPHAGYYGNETASSFFPVALTETWHWTGDDDLLRRHVETARGTIDWARRFGDRDGDGFLEYRKRSPAGLRNQGWKDSDEAIRWPDGSIVDVPIATIEEQAFHFLALERMAEILVALDEPGDEADRLLDEAASLRERFDTAYRLDAEHFYAMALDPRKRPVASIASNPLHALAAGVIPVDQAPGVADRLLGDQLFGGWGIRTLAADHPSYNPFAYHLGSVWPVENATALIGLRRYGLDDHLDRLLDAFFEAIAQSGEDRLPEAITGHARRAGSRPLPYPGGCQVQAWSASAVIQAVQAMLGIYPFAPAGVLALVRPRLPAWLPALTVRRMRIGRSTVSLRFERHEDGSAGHEVLQQDGPLLIVTGPPPNAATARNPIEWLADFGIRHAPGRLGRTLRIALGFETQAAARAR